MTRCTAAITGIIPPANITPSVCCDLEEGHDGHHRSAAFRVEWTFSVKGKLDLTPTSCDTFWGSHGCDLPRGHDGPHQCGLDDDLCSQAEGTRVRFAYEEGWGAWNDGWDLYTTKDI